VIASGSPQELIAQLDSEHVIEFSFDAPQSATRPADEWRELPAVTAARHEAQTVHLSVTEPHVALPAVLERLRDNRWSLASLTTRHASLDDVFVMLTGRQIEESDGEAK
jgi:ABC-2 type transport system ATP-binding protein